MRAILKSPNFSTLTGQLGRVHFIKGVSEDITEYDFKFLQAQVSVEASYNEPTFELDLNEQLSVSLGKQFELEVKALGGGCTYTWAHNGSTIKETSSKLVLTNTSHEDAGTYVVVVNNPYGFAISSTCTVTVQ